MYKIAFDIGNVLCRVDLDPFLIEMEKDVGAEAFSFLESIQASQDIGLFTMLQALINHGIPRKRAEELSAVWLKTVIPSQTTMDFIKDLKNKGYKIALLSNIGLDHKEYLLKSCPELSLCIQHFSCDIGVRKPSALFFQSFLNRYDWDFCVYFDDKPENFAQIDTSLPIQCVHFDLRDYTDKKGVDILYKEIIRIRTEHDYFPQDIRTRRRA